MLSEYDMEIVKWAGFNTILAEYDATVCLMTVPDQICLFLDFFEREMEKSSFTFQRHTKEACITLMSFIESTDCLQSKVVKWCISYSNQKRLCTSNWALWNF